METAAWAVGRPFHRGIDAGRALVLSSISFRRGARNNRQDQCRPMSNRTAQTEIQAQRDSRMAAAALARPDNFVRLELFKYIGSIPVPERYSSKYRMDDWQFIVFSYVNKKDEDVEEILSQLNCSVGVDFCW